MRLLLDFNIRRAAPSSWLPWRRSAPTVPNIKTNLNWSAGNIQTVAGVNWGDGQYPQTSVCLRPAGAFAKFQTAPLHGRHAPKQGGCKNPPENVLQNPSITADSLRKNQPGNGKLRAQFPSPINRSTGGPRVAI